MLDLTNTRKQIPNSTFLALTGAHGGKYHHVVINGKEYELVGVPFGTEITFTSAQCYFGQGNDWESYKLPPSYQVVKETKSYFGNSFYRGHTKAVILNRGAFAVQTDCTRDRVNRTLFYVL